jgi:general secretion pathway protein D
MIPLFFPVARLLCAGLCLFFLLLFPLGLGVAETQGKSSGQEAMEFNFRDVDITVFIQLISELTKKNFVVDPQVKGRITVISPAKFSLEDAYLIFESVLEVHGFTTVPSGAVIKIVPSVQARSKSIPTMQDDEGGTSDNVVTRIIPLAHSSPNEVQRILTPLVSKTSVVIAHEHSGILIITDVLSNIQRLMEIVQAVDVPTVGEEIAIIPLRYASVESVSRSLGQVFIQSAAAAKGGRPVNIRIIPYERTNSLIVFAPAAQIEKLRSLLEELDTEANMGLQDGKIYVYHLQHANAEELLKVLTHLPTKPTTTASSPDRPPGPSPTLSTDLKMTADPATNTLIITASREEYLVLEEVIQQLDTPRRMVYLEALIMEVSVDKNFKIGAEWGGLGSFHDKTGTLGSGFSDGSFNLIRGLEQGAYGMAAGATLGAIKRGIEIGGVYFPNIGAVLNAFRKDSDIHIVATPQILTTDNKEATITVGENVPYITSKNTSNTGSTQDYTNYEYKDIGTTLKITPQINQANLLRLDIEVEVTRLKSEAGVATPTTYKRSASTTVVVHNQEIIVIGGMIGQDTTSGDYKVPGLGDIPLLGWLFKSHEDNSRRTNMFIFITPHIVDSTPQLTNIYYKKRDILEEASTGAGEIPARILQPETQQEHIFAFLDRGVQQLRKENYEEARRYFQQALENDPENPYALMNLAAVHIHEGQTEQALARYQSILNLAEQAGISNQEDHQSILLKNAREQMHSLQEALQKKEAQEKVDKSAESAELLEALQKLHNQAHQEEVTP